jgi:hydroxypyruvate reductase
MTAKPALLALHPYVVPALAALADAFEIIAASDAHELDAVLANDGPRIVGIVSIDKIAVGAAILARTPNLRQIVALGAGYEAVDVDAARTRGVVVTSAAADLPEDVADHAIALTLAARKRLLEADRWVRSGRWAEATMGIGRRLASERIGIVGMGPIGQAIAGRIQAICPDIAWWAPREKPGLRWPRRGSLAELAGWCSVLVVAARGEEPSRGMIDKATIAAVGPDGLIVNVARGFIVDEDALIAALRSGALGQAALDVFETEPTDPARWQDVPNAILTPHIGGYTAERMAEAAATMVSNLRGILTGEPARNVIA